MTCSPEEHSPVLPKSNILRLTACSYLSRFKSNHRAHMGALFLLDRLRGQLDVIEGGDNTYRAVARAGRALARGAAAASVVAYHSGQH